MTPLVAELISALAAAKVRYTHWKSNNTLDQALQGVGDLDLLVAWEDRAKFVSVLGRLNFHLAHDRGEAGTPYVHHYYGYDSQSDRLIHLHMYFRLITCGALTKNHRLPLERILLAESAMTRAPLPTPSPEADLLSMVVRKMPEQLSLAEHLLFAKDLANTRTEIASLAALIDARRMEDILARWTPQLPAELFKRGLEALLHGSALTRIRVAARFLLLFPLTLQPLFRTEIVRTAKLAGLVLRAKLRIRGRRTRVLDAGGVVIAFTGGEASGKSTLSSAAAAAFSDTFDVARFHLGKPPRCLATRIAMAAIRSLGWLRRTTGVRIARPCHESGPRAYAPHPAVAFLDAIDRFLTARRCQRLMAQGTLVITDRYPNLEPGAVDGPSILPTGRLTASLARWEVALYAAIPEPDLVIVTTVNLETALIRNAHRELPEPEDYVRERHARIAMARFGGAPIISIDTNRPIDECANEVRRIVFDCWGGGKPALLPELVEESLCAD